MNWMGTSASLSWCVLLVDQENVSYYEHSSTTSFIQIFFKTTSEELQILYGLENNESLKVPKQPLDFSESDYKVQYSYSSCEGYNVLQGELGQKYCCSDRRGGWLKDCNLLLFFLSHINFNDLQISGFYHTSMGPQLKRTSISCKVFQYDYQIWL